MAINWFPGHMHKARKEIKKVMSEVDVVIELLDARIPFSSSNPLVGSLRGELANIDREVEQLTASMQRSITESQRFIDSLKDAP